MNNIKIQYPSITILLTALLCILKLTGILSISWWWCFCLIWMPFAIILAILGILVLVVLIYAIIYVITENLNTK